MIGYCPKMLVIQSLGFGLGLARAFLVMLALTLDACMSLVAGVTTLPGAVAFPAVGGVEVADSAPVTGAGVIGTSLSREALPPSPTTIKGAQIAGWASLGSP